MEKDKKRRAFGFGWCCSCSLIVFIAIVTLGSVLPVVLIPREIIVNDTTTTIPTSVLTTSNPSPTTSTSLPTTSPSTTVPGVTPPPIFIISNIVEYSYPKNKFIRMNYTMNEIPISLVVYQESISGVVDWTTKIPCFNTLPITYFVSHTVTIDTIDQSILVNALCLNFTANMTFPHTFKFDTNGNLLWRTQLSPAVLSFFYSGSYRSTIIGNDIIFAYGVSSFSGGIIKIDKSNGNILNLKNQTQLASFCTNFSNYNLESVTRMENNTLLHHIVKFITTSQSQFCLVYTDLNFNLIRIVEGNYFTLNTIFTSKEYYFNTTDGSHTAINTPQATTGFFEMVKYNSSGSFISNYNVPVFSDRLYGRDPYSQRYPFVFYNGFHYSMIGWLRLGNVLPQTQTTQMAKYDFINNNFQFGPDILLATYPSVGGPLGIARNAYYFTSPQLLNNSLVFAAYQGLFLEPNSPNKYQFIQYYQFPITI